MPESQAAAQHDMIANARMYALVPEAAVAWRALLLRVAVLAGVDWSYEEHAAPLPIQPLWQRNDLGCVFMCGLPFALRAADADTAPLLLAAPVPAPARYAGQPRYFSEFIVAADAPFTSLRAALGTRLACMLPESNSGYNAPRQHLMALLPPGTPAPFIATVAPTTTPMAVVRAVVTGQAEVGVVDSYALDLLRRYAPTTMAQLRTLDTTAAAPIPVLVASAGTPPATVLAVRQALLQAHLDPLCRAQMDILLLQQFAAAKPADYQLLAQQQAAADARGFALTGAPASTSSTPSADTATAAAR